MTRDEVQKKIQEVIRETFDDETLVVERETTAEDVEDWDSISNIELMVALEETFAIRLKTGELSGLNNVGELADVIVARVNEGD